MAEQSRQHRRGDRGIASLEFIGLLPFVILVAMLVFQLGVVGWATTSASQAARAGARAASLGGSVDPAARQAIPDQLRAHYSANGSCDNKGVCRATVTVRIPQVVPVLDPGSVTRTVEMPGLS